MNEHSKKNLQQSIVLTWPMSCFARSHTFSWNVLLSHIYKSQEAGATKESCLSDGTTLHSRVLQSYSSMFQQWWWCIRGLGVQEKIVFISLYDTRWPLKWLLCISRIALISEESFTWSSLRFISLFFVYHESQNYMMIWQNWTGKQFFKNSSAGIAQHMIVTVYSVVSRIQNSS